MFKTNSNQDRVNYSDMLIPPSGFVLEKAVGTTYSLDLETLTAVTIALGLHEEVDSGLMQSPISLLHALHKVSEKMLVFCEAGQIGGVRKASPLMLLLEKIVIPVALPKKRGRANYPSFHPKTWVLQYVNGEGKRFYRFVVLSRNLTFDRSWDISVCIESTDRISQTEKTKPIIDFLGFLRNQIDNTFNDSRKKRRMIKSLMSDLADVSFTLGSREFGEDFVIMPLGIGSSSYDLMKDPLYCQKLWTADYSFNELVIVSPFLGATTIEYWNRSEHDLKDTTRTLITRKTELEKLSPKHCDRFKIYVLKDDILDGEEIISEDTEDKQRQDIHAKIYLRRKNADVSLYMGSMNASIGAITSNVEMMIRLGTRWKYLDGKNFLKDLFGDDPDGPTNPFTEVEVKKEAKPETDNPKDQLERKIKELCRMKMRATVIANKDKFDVSVNIDIPDGWDCSGLEIAPLRREVWKPIQKDMEFCELEILQLTEFYQIKAQTEDVSLKRIIMIPTTGFPEDRENVVVNKIVNDKKTFAEYVAFLLGDDYMMTLLEENSIGKSGFLGSAEDRMPPLYEKMLKTALTEPERLKEIQYLVKMISDQSIVPDEFRKMYETFLATLRLN